MAHASMHHGKYILWHDCDDVETFPFIGLFGHYMQGNSFPFMGSLQGTHPKTLLMQQMARAFFMVEPTLSRATPPTIVPITPVTTVMAPNFKSAPSGVMLNTLAPALGPQYAYAPNTPVHATAQALR